MIFFFLFSSFFILSCYSFSTPNPTAGQRKTFLTSSEENLKPTRWDVGNTTISNEDRYELFHEHIKNLGGGYFGVGSIQNFSFASWARSEWIWLMDFTRIVVAANKIHIVFLKEASNPSEFRRLWSKKAKKEAYRLISKYHRQDKNRAFIRRTWRVAGHFLRKRMKLLDTLTKNRNYKIWLNHPPHYQHLRKLALSNRIRALHGDLTGNITAKAIAEAAQKMKITIRVVYFSNAEEYFKYTHPKKGILRGYSPTFRKNWLKMPFDKKTTIIRTVSVLKNAFSWAEGSDISTDRGFHYNITNGLLFQEWLAHNKKVSVLTTIKDSIISPHDSGLSMAVTSPLSPAASDIAPTHR